MEIINDGQNEQESLTPEEFLAQQKANMRRKSLWGIGLGAVVVLANIAVMWFLVSSPEYAEEIGITKRDFFSHLFRNIFFLLGLFFIVAGFWGLYEARRLTIEDFITSPEAVEFLRQAQGIVPYYSYIILACLVAVYIAQVVVGDDTGGDFKAIDTAGLVKPDTWEKGEYWRILTAGFLHGGALHIFFNAQAFHGFGSLIEVLSNRSRLAIIFLLSIVGGSVFSMIFMPEGRSVGASGGIMGLIGYLAIYGYRRRRQLPPNFMKEMVVNIGFVAAFGLVAYQIIDNFAHLGGLLIGTIYGFLTVPKDLTKNPREISAFTDGAGIVAIVAVAAIALLTIFLITERIKF